MVYRSSRRQAQRDGAPESESLQEEPSFAPDFEKDRNRLSVGRWRTIAIFLALLVAALLIAVIVLAHKEDLSSPSTCGQSSRAQAAMAINKNTIDLSEPNTPSPFHDLTKHELRQIRTFLENDPIIKAAKPESLTMSQSMVYMIDLLPAKKGEVLEWLDRQGPMPERRARVMMYHGDRNPPIVYEYSCGPLPNIRSCDVLDNPTRRNPTEFSLRPFSAMDFETLYRTVLAQVDKELGYVLRESYGTTFTDCENPKDCFKLYPSPLGTNIVGDINKRRMWVWAMYNVEYYALHPVNFGVLCVLDGSNPADYRPDKIYYNSKVYNSVTDFIKWYNTTGREGKLRLRMPTNKQEQYSSLFQRGDPLPQKPQRPPTLVEPDGRRYSLKDRKVEYLGWSFHFRMSALTGPSLFDIRYKGERIAYELGMAEIAVFYAGSSPGPQSTDFVDSGALIGSHSKSLVPGGDCPETATFINQTFSGQTVSEPVELARSFCLFENNNGYPLRRHLSYSQSEGAFYGGMLDSALVLRSALTVVNYDYIMDFIFHQNGVIETRIMSTGYIMSNFYQKNEDPYGFNIAENLMGNIHHHIFHFKADLDISGTSNRYETLNIVPDQVTLHSAQGRRYHQEKYVRSLKKFEMDALYNYNFDTPRYHIVHNNDEKTEHGAIKAYRLDMQGMSKQLLPEGVDNEVTVPWARHQLVVTKHKDEELVSSSPYAMWDSLKPVTDFSKFYKDNDSIVDEDLVLWITTGMHHIPHTEDLPLTPTVGNHLKFFLLPYNYFKECPSVASRDHIRIQHKDILEPKKGVKVERNGNSKDQCLTPPYAQDYEDLLEENPDVIVETNGGRGIF